MMRVCKKCGEEKSLEDFHKQKGYKDGISNTCKKCHNEKNKSYPIDKERRAKKNKAWRLENPDRVKMIRRKSSQKRWDTGKVQEYRALNRTRLLAYKKEWREKHRDEENKRTQEWRMHNPEVYRQSSRKTKLKRKDANRQLNNAWYKKDREYLGDNYVIKLMGKKQKISASLMRDYPELIETKRLQIKLKRLTDEKRNGIKE